MALDYKSISREAAGDLRSRILALMSETTIDPLDGLVMLAELSGLMAASLTEDALDASRILADCLPLSQGVAQAVLAADGAGG